MNSERLHRADEAEPRGSEFPGRAWELALLLVTLAVSAGTSAAVRAADDDDPDEVVPNAERFVITEQQFDQLVSRTSTTVMIVGGERRVTTSQPARKQMESALTTEVDYLARECSLTEVQKKKLQLAGRGDIVRLLDRIADLRRKYAGVAMSMQQYQEVMNELQMVGNASTQLSTFQESSLFQKTLRNSLNDEQLALYQVIERKRKVRVVESALAIWGRPSNGVKLTEETRQKLIDTLVTHGHIPSSPGSYGPYIVILEAARLEKLVTPLLTESEWQTMQARVNTARQLEPMLRKSGQWPLPDDEDKSDE